VRKGAFRGFFKVKINNKNKSIFIHACIFTARFVNALFKYFSVLGTSL
jgi:hypothetical protein